MSTVVPRHRRRDGTIPYSGQIAIMKDGILVHRESRTFNDKRIAQGWVEKREKESIFR